MMNMSMLQRFRGKIDHSSAGAQWIWENFPRYGPQGELAGQVLALCLASHHSGLIDCLKPGGENGFAARMSKDVQRPICRSVWGRWTARY